MAAQCNCTCRYGHGDLMEVKPSIKMGKKGDLSDNQEHL